jgi:hypothetical protein
MKSDRIPLGGHFAAAEEPEILAATNVTGR